VTEELDVLTVVTERLESAGVPYMVTGSIAGNYYAVPRMTRDIDIVIEASSADAEGLIELFRDEFYVEIEAVRHAIAERTVFNVIHALSVVIDDHAIFIVAPEDLIISKLDWARDSRSEVQLRDVRNLLTAAGDLDRQYLLRWVTRLGLEPLYREVAG
jgi:hypothetical protein